MASLPGGEMTSYRLKIILMFCANAARTLQKKENYFMVCNSVEKSYNLRDVYQQLLQQNV